MLGFLSRTLRKCPQKLKEKAYKTTVRPKLEYCAAIFDLHQDNVTLVFYIQVDNDVNIKIV